MSTVLLTESAATVLAGCAQTRPDLAAVGGGHGADRPVLHEQFRAIDVVSATDAVAVVPASVAATLGADVTRFRLPVDLPPVPIVLAWHRQFTADVGHQWFRALTRDVLLSRVVQPVTTRRDGDDGVA